MPIKNLTLGLCTLLAGSALAQQSYTVRNGDFDWAIAKRHGISVHKLHQMNPAVDWDALRVGRKIRVPSGNRHGDGYTVERHVSHSRTHFHVVKEGENDWIIAHRGGITLGVLKSLNPDIKMAHLRPGQKLRVPGSGGSEVAVHHRIRSTRVAVNGDDVTIRRGAGTDHDQICTVDQGTTAVVLDRDGDWYQLRFPKGTVGWVRGDLLQAVHLTHTRHHHRYTEQVAYHRSRHHRSSSHGSHSEYVTMGMARQDEGDSSNLLDKARSMQGVRYVWGEASRSGTDCSGFTSQVFSSQGVRLPRTSREQSTVGEKVTSEDLQPGDLVFFHTVRGRRVSHVGIYMGHGEFIHASSGGGKVQVNALSGYYAHRLVGARRVKTHTAKDKPAPKPAPEDNVDDGSN